MGIHYGSPVYAVDAVTERMVYYGPAVNRVSYLLGCKGGQIPVTADFITEIHRLLENFACQNIYSFTILIQLYSYIYL
jgi:class 3 adenylate cyclase